MNDEMVVGGLNDWIWNLLKNAVSLDRWDREKFKQGTGLQLDSVKDILPGTWDDALLDSFKRTANEWVDSLGKPAPLIVGDREFTAAETDLFLASCNCDEDRKAIVRESPRIMKVLYSKNKDGNDNFTDEQRRKIVGAFPFLLLIQLFGPFIIRLLMDWLSKN